MWKTLLRFWLVRFVQVFAVAFAVLAVLELVQRGLHQAHYPSVLAWAAVTALFTASVSAWWGCRRQCRAVFKDASGS